ncbi:MAG: DUF2182 domain-containing protein [Burkholderiales bacterium]|nr:DUF2182 domain-containing protein [Burkholderiales bacterium]
MATHATAFGSSAWASANRPQATLWAVLALATLLACLGLAWWGETPLARWLSREAAAAAWPRHLLFVLDWTLMCAAMMLPTALPLLSTLARVCSGQRHSGRLSLACAVAFVAVWAVSGMAVRAVHDSLYWAWLTWPSMRSRSGLLAGASLALGGTYLMLPLAGRCVTACRTPFGFVARHWTGRPDVTAQALRVGAAYGMSCLGCCWPLMAAMSLLGLSDPAWMLAAAVFMAVQKQHVAGLVLTRGLGLVMLLAGLGLGVGWLSPQYGAPAWSPEFGAMCLTR